MSALCEHCQKPAKFKCPTCVTLKLPSANFCSQECFKFSWSTHKPIHSISASMSPYGNSHKRSHQGDKIHIPTHIILVCSIFVIWVTFHLSSSCDVHHPLLSSGNTNMLKVQADQPQWLKDRPMFAGFRFSGQLRPDKLSPYRPVPEPIQRPDYADRRDGKPISEMRYSQNLTQKTAGEIETMRQVADLAIQVLQAAGQFAKPGVSTDEVDKIVHEKCIELGVYPSPLNYRNFPKSCCTSVNEVICHGIPDARLLLDGDILNVDITIYFKGHHADLNETWLIGDKVKKVHKELVQTSYECLEKAIEICKPGQMYREIGNIISKHAHKKGFSVVKSYCGHGIGRLFHCAPNVPHFAQNKAIGIMKVGHVFTIEPMINEGSYHDTLWPDNWTSTTQDGGYSAQFEHTLVITETGCDVLTRRRYKTYLDRF